MKALLLLKFVILMLITHSSMKAQCEFSYNGQVVSLISLIQSKIQPNDPGIAYALIHQDSVLVKGGRGKADVSKGADITSTTPFYIASVGKVLTAISILKLREAEKLSLNDYVSKYISGVPEALEPVRIYHLLTHTSGIPDYYETFGEDLVDFLNEDVMDFVKNIDSLHFEPGTDYEYSNTSYILLSEIIAHVNGHSFAEFVKKNIFIPLGMHQSVVYDNPGIEIDNRAIGYSRHKSGEYSVNDYRNIYTTGAGGVYASVEDLIKLLLGLESLLNDKDLGLLFDFPTTTKGQISYLGMGWSNETFGTRSPEYQGLEVFGAIGILKGFRSKILIFPNLKLTFICLSNSGDMVIWSHDLAKAIITHENE